jgi:hypothetical protein
MERQARIERLHLTPHGGHHRRWLAGGAHVQRHVSSIALEERDEHGGTQLFRLSAN